MAPSSSWEVMPRWSSSFRRVRMSRTRGTRRRVSVSSDSRLAVSAGRAAFLAPLAATRPARRVGPTMWNFSMTPFLIQRLWPRRSSTVRGMPA